MERISRGKALNATFLNDHDGGFERGKKTDRRMAWRFPGCVIQARSAGQRDSESVVRETDAYGPGGGHIR